MSFYLTAMLFIVFDIEIVFLYPVAVVLDQVCSFALAEFGFFIGILAIAYVYVVEAGCARVAVRRKRLADYGLQSERTLMPGKGPSTFERELGADELEERLLLTTVEKAVAWAQGYSIWPDTVRARLLRDRDDVDRPRAMTSPASGPRCSAPRHARPTC